jgi:fibronectin type 3 domain-containing protein
VNLSWTASTGPNGVASYFIEQCSGAGCTTFAQIASTAATSYSVTGLVATTSYSYRVRATDSSGNIGPYSTVVSASTTAVNAPSSLTATASSSLKIALGWTASTDPAVNSYLIERCAGSGCTSFSQVATSPTASYNDTSLASATTYQYRVRAQDTAGNTSAYSNTASATTLAVAPPSGLTATVQSSDSIKLSWSASSDPALSAYLIERCSGQSCSAFAQVASATTTTYTDATLLALTPYSYRVRATDANGNMSTYTSVVSGTTQGVGAPGTLTTTAQSSSQVNLSWGASNDSALASYRVQRCSESACTNFVQIASTTTTTYSDMGLTFGTLYRYRVYAIDTAGNASPYTNIAAVTTPYPTNTQPPSTPTNLTATAASNTQIDLSWTASTDLIAVTNYLVQRCAGSGCSNFVQIGTSTVASYSDSGLVANSTYCYRVQATDAAGNLSGFSNVVTAATGTGAQTYTYDSGGHLKTITTSGGTTFTYSYDAAGNLTGIQRSP